MTLDLISQNRSSAPQIIQATFTFRVLVFLALFQSVHLGLLLVDVEAQNLDGRTELATQLLLEKIRSADEPLHFHDEVVNCGY